MGAARAIERAATNWDVAPFVKSEALSTQFADLLGGLSGRAEMLAREAVSTLINAFFAPGVHIPRQGGRGFLGKAATDS